MKTKIFHTTNSALLFRSEKQTILLDGIYCPNEHIQTVGMTPMSSSLINMMRANQGVFHDIDLLLFTHNHHDHFDLTLIKEFLDNNPNVLYYAPKDKMNSINHHKGEEYCSIHMDSLEIKMLETDHLYMADIVPKTPHYCYTFSYENECFFIASDAIINKNLYERLRPQLVQPVTCAFVNIIQLSSAEGREFVRLLNPEQLVLYHIPEKKDDLFNFASLIKNFTKHYPEDFPELHILTPMSWLDL